MQIPGQIWVQINRYRQPLAQPRHRGRTASDLEATGPSHPDMDLDARTDVRFRVLGVLR
nr:TniB NTP-binding protein [Proteus mirabilis]